jgi:hypothetical protein
MSEPSTDPLNALRARRRRTNIDRQERVVSALWELARDMQNRPSEGCVATAGDGTKLSLGHCGKALREIMDTFGYDVLEVQ